jgi:hypothetical protein
MRWTLVLVVPFVALMVAALQLTQQQVLWSVTEPGMTVEEVRRAIPTATPPAAPKQLANGLELKLVAFGVDNLERAFDAELYFRDGGLQKVLLHPTRRLTAGAAASAFEELRHAASLRYGKERPAGIPSVAGTAAEARWVSGRVTITLRLEDQGAMGRVTMTYATDRAA